MLLRCLKEKYICIVKNLKIVEESNHSKEVEIQIQLIKLSLVSRVHDNLGELLSLLRLIIYLFYLFLIKNLGGYRLIFFYCTSLCF
jgi:hypothetical protein